MILFLTDFRKRFAGILAGLALLLCTSCGTAKWTEVNYLQDIQQDSIVNTALSKGFLIQPHDKIIIVVSSRNNAVAAQFNKPVFTTYVGTETEALGGTHTKTTVYTVDNEGCINFPVFGMIKVSGMTRWDAQKMLENRLKDEGLLSDANVTVLFHDIKYFVLGEVEHPGSFFAAGDKVTVLQALASAGDLTIYGRRDNVKVVREVNGTRQTYVMDLRSSDIFDSPGYYLTQDDVVYVTPNNSRATQSTASEKQMRNSHLWAQWGMIGVTALSVITTAIINSRR